MELRREIGALSLSQAPMGRVYRKLLVVVGLLFLAIFSFKLEMGRVKFWHDVWCGDNPLSTCFPNLFRINNDKEAYVADLIQFPNGVLFWDLEFQLEIHDRESDSLFVFWNVIY